MLQTQDHKVLTTMRKAVDSYLVTGTTISAAYV